MDELNDLMETAGLRVDDAEARRCLSTLLQSARLQCQPSTRPLAADHDAQLARIKQSASLLREQIEKLRDEPYVWNSFWLFPGFETSGQELPDVFNMLKLVELAAEAGVIEAKGRPREARKQNIVNFARVFYERFVGHATETLTSGFANFARAFYSHAGGEDPESIDRQIRSSVSSARAQKARANSGLPSVS